MSCEFIGWCALSSEAQAAWAQAVLSALGIAAVPLITRHIDRRRLARSLAFSLHEDLVVLEERLEAFDTYTGHNQDDLEDDLDSNGVKGIFELPQNLRMASREIHNLGRHGTAVLNLVKALNEGKAAWASRDMIRGMNGDTRELTDKVLSSIRQVRGSCKVLRSEIFPEEAK